MLYPRDPLRKALERHPEMAARVFQGLQHITPAQMVSEGRVYGGGLYKVEPKELAQIPARSVIESMATHLQFEHQGSLFN
jgi:hypothetical protein